MRIERHHSGDAVTTMPAVRLVVTRPAAQAQAWAQALGEHGVSAQSLPLIEIGPMPDASALRAAWLQAQSRAHLALMFVSAHAVQHFMAARPAACPLTAQAWGTGPGTRSALLAAGWPQALIRCPDAQAPRFDSEALWAMVQGEVKQATAHSRHTAPCAPPSVLIVRGADAQGQLAGRDWLAQQLQAVGVDVCQCAAYVRAVPDWDAATRARAHQALHDGSWWLFSSAQAAQHLAQLLPGAVDTQAQALATHPRIAERLRAQGWGRVESVPATLAGVVAWLESQA